MSEAKGNVERVIATVAVDLERSPVGTRSRLQEELGGKTVLRRTVERVLAVGGIERVVLMVAQPGQGRESLGLGGLGERVEVMELMRRPATVDRRVRVGRGWGLMAWRGGAGQGTVFDEDYHPLGVWQALARFGGGAGSEEGGWGHVVSVPAHAGLLDSTLLGALVEHHLHKNHEMRVTFAPAAPGLCGMVLRGDVVKDMAEAGGGGALPGHLLGYDPQAPTFDTLVRDACMQVDPALSKIPNRFLLDTDRAWETAVQLEGRRFGCLAEMMRAAREGVEGFWNPQEVEIELTGRRVTQAMGGVPVAIREGRRESGAEEWERWWGEGIGRVADDLVVTLGGDGDPLLGDGLGRVLRAIRKAGVENIHVQTDLLEGTERLLEAVGEGLVDVVSVMVYGYDEETYEKVGGVKGYARAMGNLDRVLGAVSNAGRGVPLVVPRLLKVRETIPQMEAFFDRWVGRCGWAVIDGPTDRAGEVAFTGVVDMGPPKRKACRRLGTRLVIRCDGVAVACDQDVRGKLVAGEVRHCTLEQMWRGQGMMGLRRKHGEGQWSEIEVCARCREWYRA